MNHGMTTTARPNDRPGRAFHGHEPDDPLKLDPATTYEVLTRRMVEDLSAEVSAIRGRIDTMFWIVIVSSIMDALLRLAG